MDMGFYIGVILWALSTGFLWDACPSGLPEILNVVHTPLQDDSLQPNPEALGLPSVCNIAQPSIARCCYNPVQAGGRVCDHVGNFKHPKSPPSVARPPPSSLW